MSCRGKDWCVQGGPDRGLLRLSVWPPDLKAPRSPGGEEGGGGGGGGGY